jgi:hypothetical protein
LGTRMARLHHLRDVLTDCGLGFCVFEGHRD